MASESDNKQKLKLFFSEEYKSLEIFVKLRIKKSADKDADDIIQDVAMKLFERADNLAPIKNVAGFVYRSVKNKIIDILRTNHNKSYVEDYYEDFINEFSSVYFENKDQPYSEELKIELFKAISLLKPKYKEIIHAVDFGGNTFKEISKKTNIPIGTLLSRHHRALGILTEHLEQFKNK